MYKRVVQPALDVVAWCCPLPPSVDEPSDDEVLSSEEVELAEDISFSLALAESEFSSSRSTSLITVAFKPLSVKVES